MICITARHAAFRARALGEHDIESVEFCQEPEDLAIEEVDLLDDHERQKHES